LLNLQGHSTVFADPTSTYKLVIIFFFAQFLLLEPTWWGARTDAASEMSFDKGQLTQGQNASVDYSTLRVLFWHVYKLVVNNLPLIVCLNGHLNCLNTEPLSHSRRNSRPINIDKLNRGVSNFDQPFPFHREFSPLNCPFCLIIRWTIGDLLFSVFRWKLASVTNQDIDSEYSCYLPLPKYQTCQNEE
jgi:hypothetical protein